MQRIVHSGKVPPGGYWRYLDPETGQEIKHPYLDQVRGRAHKHRVINNLPIPTNWEEQFENNVCENTSTATCEEASSSPLGQSFQLLARFTKAMATWAASGFKLVDDETLAARRLACEGDETHERCPQWYNSLRYFGFGRCGRCGCVGGLKTPLATEKCPLNRWPK